jgi:hypothetical protein
MISQDSTQIYRGQHPFLYWSTFVLLLFGPTAFFLLAPRLLAMMGERFPLPMDGKSIVFGLGAGVLVASLYWLRQAHLARVVSWDEKGFEVSGYRSDPQQYDWSQLAGIRVLELGINQIAQISLKDCSRFDVASQFGQYEELMTEFSRRNEEQRGAKTSA